MRRAPVRDVGAVRADVQGHTDRGTDGVAFVVSDRCAIHESYDVAHGFTKPVSEPGT